MLYNNSIFSLQKRLLAVFMLLVSIFFALACRLFYIQIVEGGWLQAKAAEQWHRELPIAATRGSIVDTNNVVLAQSYSVYDVYVRPSMISNPSQVAAFLATLFNLDFNDVFNKVTNVALSEICIVKQVDSDVANKIISSNYAGVLLSENSERYYPYGDLLTQILGFTNIDNIGQAGIEQYANQYLQGLNGYALEQSDVNGVKIDNTLSKYIPAIDGGEVKLTIDANIQLIVERALEQLMIDQMPASATAIVMDPNTGKILAMSSKPSFDLNDPPRDNVEMLLEYTKSLAIVDVYEPGSTFKVLTTATALEEGVTTPDEHFYDPGYRIVDGETIRCWKHIGHGDQTMTEALCNSCNSVFVDLALRLGVDTMYDYFDLYGLGNQLGVDFSGESAGILMNKDDVKTVDLARMGFGQAVAVTPLQLISSICSVLNGGYLYQPYLIDEIADVTNTTFYKNTPTVLNRTISQNTSDIIKDMMEQVVTNSSGINSFIPGYRISGKTGTSQKYENGVIVQKYVSSFVGAYPADNPEYVVLVIADEPTAGNYYGSVVATPYAKMIFEGIIDYKQHQPVNLEQDLMKMQENIVVPNLVNMSLTQAVSELSKLNLQYEIAGSGDYVLSQTPPPGSLAFERSIVILQT